MSPAESKGKEPVGLESKAPKSRRQISKQNTGRIWSH